MASPKNTPKKAVPPASKKPAPKPAAKKPAPKPVTKSAPKKAAPPARPAPKKPSPKKPAPKPAAKSAPKKASPPAKSAKSAPKAAAAKAAAKAPLPVKPVPKPTKSAAKKAPEPAPKKGASAGKNSKAAAPEPAPKLARKSSNTPLPPILAEAKEKHLQRVGKHTPAIFKPLRKGNTPVFFTLEDVREHLKVRKTSGDTPVTVLTAKAGAAPAAAPKKAAKPVDLNNIKVAPKVVGVASLEDILGFNPAKETAASHDESKIPQAWRKYYRLLMDLRDHVNYGLTNLSNETLKRGANEDAGDTSAYGQHLGDAGSETFDRDFALNMLSNEQEALNEIDAALDRIFKGTYGICEITGQAIPSERLTAVPFTRFTIAGQKEYELRKRRREQRGNLFVEAEEPAAEPVEEV